MAAAQARRRRCPPRSGGLHRTAPAPATRCPSISLAPPSKVANRPPAGPGSPGPVPYATVTSWPGANARRLMRAMWGPPHSAHRPALQYAVGALCERGGGTHALPSGGQVENSSPP
eukprot:1734293-Alexandrium_andersonii.AAC.1